MKPRTVTVLKRVAWPLLGAAIAVAASYCGYITWLIIGISRAI